MVIRSSQPSTLASCLVSLLLCLYSNISSGFVVTSHKTTKITQNWASLSVDARIERKEGLSSHGRGPEREPPNVVLVAGFESFNRELYQKAANELDINLQVFAESDIRVASNRTREPNDLGINPVFKTALQQADAFIGSLIFDYDDVLAVKSLLEGVTGPRLVFESAIELMEFNQVGTFNMLKVDDGSAAGPPPAIKAVLSKFGSGKEEDKLNGYLKLLKIGPDLLKFVPGEKASDLRTWLEAYRFWNQGGASNVQAMLDIVASLCREGHTSFEKLPELQVTPDIGLIHPLRYQNPEESRFFESPRTYLFWRLSDSTKQFAIQQNFHLAPDDAPKVAILLYRKHVITEQRYLLDLLTIMEKQGILPIPIFINGVEAHTIVRDLLTSEHETNMLAKGNLKRAETFQISNAVSVDAIVNTVGFPLVGGPAGSMEAGRNVDVAKELLASMNVPYVVASPLLLQSIPQWKRNGVLGLQSVVLYSLPELDGAIDTIVLGGLVGDKIAVIPERIRKLSSRLKSWVRLRRTPAKDRKIAVSLYGFPPNVGAVGTAALLDVPRSLETFLKRLHEEGYDVGVWATDPDASGESLVAALTILCENSVVVGGSKRMQSAVDGKIERATSGDTTVAETLARPGGGLGGARVVSRDVTPDELERMLGKYMATKVHRAWSERDSGLGVSANGDFVVAGLQVGNVWIFVQPLLGIEGDPMRLLFERDLTPHPQYCATYEWLKLPASQGGFGANAMIHFGMHGTVEWLPGQPLGNDRKSWSDELLGDLPNIYVYAANNPSESILAKRRGYASIVSYNVPPYGRSGLYLELASLKDLIDEYRASHVRDDDLFQTVYELSLRSGIVKDVPVLADPQDSSSAIHDVDLSLLSSVSRSDWILRVGNYLSVLQDRLFSSGLRVLGSSPTDDELFSYVEAYFGDRISPDGCRRVIALFREKQSRAFSANVFLEMISFVKNLFGSTQTESSEATLEKEALNIVELLDRSTEELDAVLSGLNGGYILPAPGGDLLRDGISVLPTGRNIHALDPYRMPSAGAWARGQRAAREIIRQHQESNNEQYPQTVAVTLWGLSEIKTRGESVAIVLALVGACPLKEGTGRIVRYDLIPLNELGRPRIDVLASLSGIFRDSFANIVDLLDDMFERAASANEPEEMNFIRKHANELLDNGVTERTAARLFSNP